MSTSKDIHARRRSPGRRALKATAPAVGGEAARPMPALALRRIQAAPEPLKCVWSHDGGCQACIPANLVLKLWEHQMSLRESREGFFHVTWRDGTWLAYGAGDGKVRGVYCPTHTAERAGRQQDAGASAPARAVALP